MFDGVPWMIGGGDAVHSAEVGRQLAFMASAGATGVTLPGDLKVTALPTPGSAVRIAPGGGPIALLNAPGQSYVVRNPEATDVAIPATGSEGGATRYVVVRVDDPQYGGAAPADPATGPYVRPEVVSSLAGLAYPYMELARIDQPASTATITQGMVTDLREMANPREKSYVFPYPTTSGGFTYELTSTTGARFPNYSGALVKAPAWATRMQIRTDWTSIRYLGTTKRGEHWVRYGPTATEAETRHFQWDPAENGTTGSRDNWLAADEVEIPAAWRGGDIDFHAYAKIVAGSGGEVSADPSSGLIWEIRFMEAPA